jgi:hypothetical protein
MRDSANTTINANGKASFPFTKLRIRFPHGLTSGVEDE